MHDATARILAAEEEKKRAASRASRRAKRRTTKMQGSVLGSIIGSQKSEASLNFSNASPQRTLDRDPN